MEVKVYPRVGGGTQRRFAKLRWGKGLSPRGRGNLCTYLGNVTRIGSIPAWAGEPLYISRECNSDWVYPRVGGGTLIAPAEPQHLGGLSPRGRGNLDSPEASLV